MEESATSGKDFIAAEEPLVIAGPCSAETKELVVETARALAAGKRVQLFRAGIWKPRTRPDSFEGVGAVGLEWLVEARKESGLPVITEVANARHVEQCLEIGIDAVWIGARTTVNPFYVQEIAEALRGTNIPVFVKNPVSPEIGLWIGAIERLGKANVKMVCAIHRGFTPVGRSSYRNDPLWELPIELKTQFPEIKMLCDPSHIAGDKSLIKELAQRAMDLNMDGLMIETHIRPEEALTDAQQQITPGELRTLLEKITFRAPGSSDPMFTSKLEELRKAIDEIDAEMLEQLIKRMELVDEIGEYKFENKVTVFQLKRWKEILNTRINYGRKIGLEEAFLKKLLQLVHKESIRRQTAIMNKLESIKKEVNG
ncbi:MAG: chorismate mutase [Flavobacteriales bacterium]